MVNYTRLVITHLDTLGITPPKRLNDANTMLIRINAGLNKLVNPGNLEAAVVDALANGRDPLDDENVRRLSLAKTIATADLSQYVREAEQRVTIALRAVRPEIHQSLAKLHAREATRLTQAMTALGMPHLDDDRDKILNQGKDAALHYVNATEADQTLDTIGSTINTLAYATGGSPVVGGNLNLVHATGISAHALDTLGLKVKRRPWELVRLGLTLELADTAELGRRQQRIQNDRADEAQRAHDRMTGRNPNLVNPFERGH